MNIKRKAYLLYVENEEDDIIFDYRTFERILGEKDNKFHNEVIQYCKYTLRIEKLKRIIDED